MGKNILITGKNNCYSYFASNFDISMPNTGIYMYKNKMLVEALVEKIEIENKQTKICEFETVVNKYTSKNYITKELENQVSYKLEEIEYSKKLTYIEDTLCIEYIIKNVSEKAGLFKIVPFVTYKDINKMKNATSMKYGKRKLDNGTIVNLSITDNMELYIKSDSAIYKDEESYLNNVKHVDSANGKYNTEDLYIPGYMYVTIRPYMNISFNIYIHTNKGTKNIDNRLEYKVEEKYPELFKLTKSIKSFELGFETDKLPVIQNINYTNIVKSIEGRYLIFNHLEKAKDELIKFTELNNQSTRFEMWMVESINKLYNLDPDISEYLKKYVYDVTLKVLDMEFEYLEDICLKYNTLRIYENVFSELSLINKANDVLKEIEENFLVKDINILKFNRNDIMPYATAEMLYALALSYTCISNEYTYKILDTIFKELYTPLGIRNISKNSNKYNYEILPSFMTLFIKANLRQNGVTFASKKISYNLVKELLQEIDKYEMNTVKAVYSEKGYNISNNIDIFVTSEMARLYDMLI